VRCASTWLAHSTIAIVNKNSFLMSVVLT
jgi:hypothetical protein